MLEGVIGPTFSVLFESTTGTPLGMVIWWGNSLLLLSKTPPAPIPHLLLNRVRVSLGPRVSQVQEGFGPVQGLGHYYRSLGRFGGGGGFFGRGFGSLAGGLLRATPGWGGGGCLCFRLVPGVSVPPVPLPPFLLGGCSGVLLNPPLKRKFGAVPLSALVPLPGF